MKHLSNLAEATERCRGAFDRLEESLRRDGRISYPPPEPLPQLTVERIIEMKLLVLKSNSVICLCQLLGITPTELGDVFDAAKRGVRDV